MGMHPYCPSCGFNFERDKPVTLGRWTLEPSHATYDGKPVDLTAMESQILHTIATAKGRPIHSEVIGSRVSYAADPRNLVAVSVLKMRRKLGNICPIVTVRGAGYRWGAM